MLDIKQLKFTKISVFNSIIFFYYLDNNKEKIISLSFVIDNSNISINFNKNNNFLSEYKFNHLNIKNFLLNLITNTTINIDKFIIEDDIPF